MFVLGIAIEGTSLKIALLSKIKDQLVIHKLEESDFHSIQEYAKGARVVSALPADTVLHRNIKTQMSQLSSVLKTLPFQLETNFPFLKDDMVVYPSFPSRQRKEKSPILVSCFITTLSALRCHLDELASKGIDSDHVSSVPSALSSWAKWICPHTDSIAFVHDHTVIALERGQIIETHWAEDREQLELFLEKKLGGYQTLNPEVKRQEYSFETLKNFAVPLGLALQGFGSDGCQFREKKIPIYRQFKTVFTVGLFAWAGIIYGLGDWSLEQQMSEFRNLCHQTMPYHPLSEDGFLEDNLMEWINKQSRSVSLVPDVYSVSDLLAWIGCFSEKVDVIECQYELINKEGKFPYRAKINLEFQTENPAIAHTFREFLEKPPTLLDKTQPVVWTPQRDSYKISFCLQKK